MEKAVFVKLRHRVQVKPDDVILVGDVAQIIASDKQMLQQLKRIPLYRIQRSDKNIVIVDVMKVVDAIVRFDPSLEIQTIGSAQTIVEVVYPKRTISFAYFLAVWLLLFIGSAIAIINFHEDVSMQETHQHLYTIITGEKADKPLLFQIPYSIGLGLGMIIFFNHVFRKRINEEPSPLEVEMFNYQQSLDQYVILHENKESMKQIDDR
ncbi:stage V sporulation protein AA [Anoxybacillus rupiensis]|uniref:Stage V sporulation protein AA n=1 Tax=Anoxybacteroides rupiense TaxID=311460 RepID=A0ABD5IV70_9BACL|nr:MULTISPECIES: stage V sporulation protein AA [Anoxybacillus]MBS2770163.1 stage V sporulation protein AA [Anoxybacillus rupiensis]MDE8562462.1 stage V sporulation protein AA [Anoxybacillus rupiensis]MED5052088.1 stage V sporulation protein AA [Anoxybacillus rupiensis]OQM45066.1 stage V sporulation protein AA [Anoxybacillus sp. UARK-01]QHC04640.1 stage V sporulation protein AA [Anoxybacillus sp. PDR2]